MRLSLLYITSLIFFFGCVDENLHVGDGYRLFITLQDSDGVAIISSDNLALLDNINIDLSVENMGMPETPHDVAIDNTNGYWFASTIMEGYIGMYGLEDNELIDSYLVGDQPALLAVDETNQKLYVSRMMPMSMSDDMDMGSTTNIIHELSYGAEGLEPNNEFNLQFPSPHAIAFDNVYGNIYTASNTNDFLAKINPNVSDGEPDYKSLDPEISNNPEIPVNRLKPLQISVHSLYLFVSCTGGAWQNSDGQEEFIPGQVQMRELDDMSLIKTFEFDTYSHPWHIETSLSEDKVFVALAGDTTTESGVACLEFGIDDNGEYFLNQVWKTTESEYGTMHGITISADGQYVYASGRTDGNIYKFDASTGEELGYLNLISSGGVRTGGIALSQESCCN